MARFFLALLVSFLALIGRGNSWSFWGYSSSCTYTRQDAVKCFERHVDTNKDGIISMVEVDAARTKYTGRLFKAIEWFASWGIDISSAKILSDCDFNHDGKFTPDDFIRSYKTCVPTQAGLCIIKKVCDAADAEQEEEEKAKTMREVKPPRSWRSYL